MPRYQLMAGHYLNDVHYPMGAVVEHDDTPSKLMRPLDAEATARSEAVLAELPQDEQTKLRARWVRAAQGQREPAGYT